MGYWMSRIICNSAQIKADGKIALRRHRHAGCCGRFAPLTRSIRQGYVAPHCADLAPTPRLATDSAAQGAEESRARQRSFPINLCFVHRRKSTAIGVFMSRQFRRMSPPGYLLSLSDKNSAQDVVIVQFSGPKRGCKDTVRPIWTRQKAF
jgi:hypothetical protein